MGCTRRALSLADQPDLVAAAAAALRRGGLCVLPTETVYGLGVLPTRPDAVARVQALKGRADDHVFTWHVADRADFGRLAVDGDWRAQRLLDRYCPGPLTLVLPGRAGGTAGIRMPAHAFTRAVIAAVGQPIWLTSVNRSGEPPLCDPVAIEREFGPQLALLVDDGPSPIGMASTVVRCTGPRLEILREGILTGDEVLATAAADLLFVCTGNTCRSPLAEALARRLLARELDVQPVDLPARGLRCHSAGIATIYGMPASDGSILAAAETGLELRAHTTTPVDGELLRRADRIYCLAASHLQALAGRHPATADKATLLLPDGGDVDDPFGGGLDDYRRARDQIAAAVTARLPEWLALLAHGP